MRLAGFVKLADDVEIVAKAEILGVLQRLEPVHHFVDGVGRLGDQQVGEDSLHLLAVGKQMVRAFGEQLEDHSEVKPGAGGRRPGEMGAMGRL